MYQTVNNDIFCPLSLDDNNDESNVDNKNNTLQNNLYEIRLIRLVYASSSSVYGFNTKIPFSEQDAVSNPTSLYASTKRANELMATTYHNLYGLSVVGLRFFTVYGPWGRPDMAYWSFLHRIFNNEPIEVCHNGKASRDFTFVSDIVDGIERSLRFIEDPINFLSERKTEVTLLEKETSNKSLEN